MGQNYLNGNEPAESVIWRGSDYWISQRLSPGICLGTVLVSHGRMISSGDCVVDPFVGARTVLNGRRGILIFRWELGALSARGTED